MMAIKFSALAAALLVASPALATPVNPDGGCTETAATAEGFALARGIVNAALPQESTDQMMRQLLVSMSEQMKASWMQDSTSDPGLDAIRDRFLAKMPDRVVAVSSKHMPAIREAMACAYTHAYDIEELRQINAFARTTAGSHFLSTSMKTVSDPAVAQANQAYLRDAKVMMDAMAQDLAAEIAEYKSAKEKKAGGKK